MKCVCSEGRWRCYGQGTADVLVVHITGIKTEVYECRDDITEVYLNPRVTVERRTGDGRAVIVVYV